MILTISQGRVQQLTGQLLDNHPYPVGQNGSNCRQAIHYVVYRLPAIACILFYWIRMKVVQQLTYLTLGRPNGPAYSTGELLNTPNVTSSNSSGGHISLSLCSL